MLQLTQYGVGGLSMMYLKNTGYYYYLASFVDFI